MAFETKLVLSAAKRTWTPTRPASNASCLMPSSSSLGLTLRIGGYRVFYEVRVGGVVRVLAVGHKRHNELFIRGQKVESIKEMKDGDRLLSLYNGAKLGVTITLPYQTGEKKKTVESKEFLFGSSLPVSD